MQEEDSEKMNLPVYFRERHSKHGGGSTGTMLFGQPLLITVPRLNLIADVLYEKILERIGYDPSCLHCPGSQRMSWSENLNFS